MTCPSMTFIVYNRKRILFEQLDDDRALRLHLLSILTHCFHDKMPDEQPQSDVLLRVVDHVPAPSLLVDGDIEANPGPKSARLPGQQDISAF